MKQGNRKKTSAAAAKANMPGNQDSAGPNQAKWVSSAQLNTLLTIYLCLRCSR